MKITAIQAVTYSKNLNENNLNTKNSQMTFGSGKFEIVINPNDVGTNTLRNLYKMFQRIMQNKGLKYAMEEANEDVRLIAGIKNNKEGLLSFSLQSNRRNPHEDLLSIKSTVEEIDSTASLIAKDIIEKY